MRSVFYSVWFLGLIIYCEGCLKGQYACANGECISEEKKCDYVSDCSDRSDEQDCVNPCKSARMKPCRKGHCISTHFFCDGENDCGDWSDEFNCTRSVASDVVDSLPCPATSFHCKGHMCIPETWVCDGTEDCLNGLDERHCTVVGECKNGFKCGNECILSQWVCDGVQDCSDGSDEKECDSVLFLKNQTTSFGCATDQFECHSGGCISAVYVCDGDYDCHDLSDEPSTCPSPKCAKDEFLCANNRSCIPMGAYCDGQRDCADGSDEANCTKKCSPTQFYCEQSRLCIPNSWTCDGDEDCAHGEDESNCSVPPPCPANSIRCPPQTECIPKITLCDGPDCVNATNEQLCARFDSRIKATTSRSITETTRIPSGETEINLHSTISATSTAQLNSYIETPTDFISRAKNVQLKANVSHIEIIPLNKNLNETTEESMEHTDLKPSTPTAENSSVSINLNHHEHSKTVSNILIRMFGRQNTFFKFHVPSKKGALQVELSANVSGMPNKSEPIEIVVGHIKDEDLDV